MGGLHYSCYNGCLFPAAGVLAFGNAQRWMARLPTMAGWSCASATGSAKPALSHSATGPGIKFSAVSLQRRDGFFRNISLSDDEVSDYRVFISTVTTAPPSVRLSKLSVYWPLK